MTDIEVTKLIAEKIKANWVLEEGTRDPAHPEDRCFILGHEDKSIVVSREFYSSFGLIPLKILYRVEFRQAGKKSLCVDGDLPNKAWQWTYDKLAFRVKDKR